MQDDEDPENPFVWLNSYSRVPVSSFNEFLKIGLGHQKTNSPIHEFDLLHNSQRAF